MAQLSLFIEPLVASVSTSFPKIQCPNFFCYRSLWGSGNIYRQKKEQEHNPFTKGVTNFMSYHQYYYDLEDQAEELPEKIVKRYASYNVSIDIREKGIIILEDRIKFPIKLRPGTRVDDIYKYAKDVQINLKLPLFQVIQEKLSLFIIASRQIVADYSLRRLLSSPEYAEALGEMMIAHPIGFDATGKPIIKDLALYPHALIAGTTGSGKSVSLKVLLISLLCKYSPSKVNLLICDRAGDLLQFSGFPHLSYPVIQDFDAFLYSMLKLKTEMERRIQLKGTRGFTRLTQIVCVVDEFTSFIAGTDAKSKLVREVIAEILRRGRHAKIHMIFAAHNPTQQRLKLDISDIPTKIAFKVSRLNNSLAVLSEGGAEKLSGNGDMLFQSSQGDELQRIQGAFISSKELNRTLDILRAKLSERPFNSRSMFSIDEADQQQTEPILEDNLFGKSLTTKQDIDDRLFAKVALWTLGQTSISCNMITEIFGFGWRRANGFIKKLHDMGIVGDLDAKLPRQVIPISLEELPVEVMELLLKNGVSNDTILNALCNKN